MNAMDKEYGDINYFMLQEIRVNSSIQYHNGSDNRGYSYVLRVMDKKMEKINMWTKLLVMSADKESWRTHSPNLVAAK